MKKIKVLILFILIGNYLIFAKEITLEDGLQILYQSNYQLKTLESKLTQAKYKKLETFSAWLPKLQTQIQYVKLSEPQMKIPPQMSMFFGSSFPPTLTSDKYYTASLTASQLLFSSGRVLSAYKISCLSYEIAKCDYEKTKKDLEIQYKEAFLKALLAKKVAEVAKKAVEISSENYKASFDFYKEGRISYLDYSSSKLNYLNAEINLLKVKSNYEIAKEVLKNVLCVDYELEPVGEIEEILTKYETEIDFSKLTSNIKNLPEIKSLKLNKKVLENNLYLTKTEILPTVSFVVNYNWTTVDYTEPYDKWDDRRTYMVTLNWPIFNGGATLSKYKQAKENLKQIELGEKSAISGLQLQLNSLYSTYIQLKESIKIAKENLELAEENYEVAKSYYMGGRISHLELLQSELSLSNTKINYYQTMTDYIVTLEKLKKFE